jgi:hypothetical protein
MWHKEEDGGSATPPTAGLPLESSAWPFVHARRSSVRLPRSVSRHHQRSSEKAQRFLVVQSCRRGGALRAPIPRKTAAKKEHAQRIERRLSVDQPPQQRPCLIGFFLGIIERKSPLGDAANLNGSLVCSRKPAVHPRSRRFFAALAARRVSPAPPSPVITRTLGVFGLLSAHFRIFFEIMLTTK